MPKISVLLSTAFLIVSTARAADQAIIEEILVTAQKREEGIQSVPMSISAYTGAQLEDARIEDITELSRFVPSFDVATSNTSRNTVVFIRGIGSSGSNPGIEPSVGVFVDGVYLPSGGQVLGNLVDVQTVEILRGPQGTLYGRNTPVGAVNVTTRRPDETPDAMVRVSAGDYDYRAVSGFASGPLGDRTAGRLSFWANNRDGYEDNLFTGDDGNDSKEYGVRGRLSASPNDRLEIDVVAHGSSRKRHCCIADQVNPLGPMGIATPGFLAAQESLGFPFRNFDDNDHVVDADDEGNDKTTTWGVSARIDWTLSNGDVLTSITAYDEWDTDAVITLDSLPQDVVTSTQQQINETWSEELRIASVDNHRLNYVAGVFFYAQDTDFDLFNVIGAGANRQFPPPLCGGVSPCVLVPGDNGGTIFEQETRSVAVFGNLTWTMSDAWDLGAGIRLSYDEKDAFVDHFNDPDSSPVWNRLQIPTTPGDVDRSDSNVTWSIDVRYRPVDGLMLFGRIATGFKSGGFNSRRLPAGAELEFDEENSITYELGLKASWFEQRLNTNVTAFWTELMDFQEAIQNPDPNVPGFIVGNAGDRRVRGFELDVAARPLAPLALGVSLGYLDAEFTDYSSAQCPPGRPPDGSLPGTCNLDGQTPAFSPEWKLGAHAIWTQIVPGTDMDWFFGVDYSFTDDQSLFESPFSESVQRAYDIINARVGLRGRDGRWELAAWGKNLADETFYVQFALQPGAGFISGGGFAGAQGFVAQYGPPRTWGVDLTYRLSE